MLHLLTGLRACRAGLALMVLAAGALTTPGPAAAKTFKAYITDEEGDAPDGSQDIVNTRVAYNRKTGAISVSLTTKDPIDPEGHDALFAVAFSNLSGGKCKAGVMMVGGYLSSPERVVGFAYRGNTKERFGKGVIDENKFTFRVRHRSLSGKTVGCVIAGMAGPDADLADPSSFLDITKGNDGFL